MKLTRGKKAALLCFGIFLGFMAVCTVVAKGIYASGLPRVGTMSPYRNSISHEIRVTGQVKQGQEYGVYVEEGLRIAEVSVANGVSFSAGENLFRIETWDLEDIVAERRLALSKLESQQSDILKEDSRKLQEYRKLAARAREDYDNILKEADALVGKCQQELERALAALKRYDSYLSDSSGSVSSGDYQGNYERQERRAQLVLDAAVCAEALEAARRQKDASLLTAARAVEDAEAAAQNAGRDPAAGLTGLDVEYQRKELEKLEEILEKDGWICAEASGRVVECRVRVGERTQDGACILYARTEGKPVLEAVFTEEQTKYISEGQSFEMYDGSRRLGTTVLENLEAGEDRRSWGRLSLEDVRVSMGQRLQLVCQIRSDTYNTCISVQCLYQESEERYYVYVAEEREGILGTEWKVRRVRVEVLDRNDMTAAIYSSEITEASRVVSLTDKALYDGQIVRVL